MGLGDSDRSPERTGCLLFFVGVALTGMGGWMLFRLLAFGETFWWKHDDRWATASEAALLGSTLLIAGLAALWLQRRLERRDG